MCIVLHRRSRHEPPLSAPDRSSHDVEVVVEGPDADPQLVRNLGDQRIEEGAPLVRKGTEAASRRQVVVSIGVQQTQSRGHFVEPAPRDTRPEPRAPTETRIRKNGPHGRSAR